MNLIQLLAIGLLYTELLVSNRVLGVNHPKLTGNGSVTGCNGTGNTPIAPAWYLMASNSDLELGIRVPSATRLELRNI